MADAHGVVPAPNITVDSPVDAGHGVAITNASTHAAPAGHHHNDAGGRSSGGEQHAEGASDGTAAQPTIRKDTYDFEPSTQDAFYEAISASLKKGTYMLKVSAKKVQRRLVRIKPEAGQLLWESKHAGIREIASCITSGVARL